MIQLILDVHLDGTNGIVAPDFENKMTSVKMYYCLVWFRLIWSDVSEIYVLRLFGEKAKQDQPFISEQFLESLHFEHFEHF